MSAKPVALIGDIHGISEEFEELLEWFYSQGIQNSNIWILGDILDRGPDSGKCVRICRQRRINSILGNHENSILNRWSAKLKGNPMRHHNPDKEKTISQLTQDDIDWILKLPPIHIFDDLQLVLVHGGVFPHIPFFKQPKSVIRAQMIQPWNPGPSRWWGPQAALGSKYSEEESHAQGWKRWYECYDHQYDIAFGHSVFQHPLIYKNPGSGTCFGLDQGGVFGGWLTGMIYFGKGDYHIKQIRAKKVYCEDMFKQFGDLDE